MITVVARWLGVVAWLVVLGVTACDPGEGEHVTEHEGSTGTTSGSSGPSGPTDTGAEAVCGDDVVEADEHCDGMDLAGATCASLGHGAGTLACAADCTFDKTGCTDLPGTPVLMLGFSPIKQFDFGWAAVDGADYYQLEESAAPGEPFVPLGGDVVGTSVSHTMPLHLRHQASYRVQACNVAGCTSSAEVPVMSSLAEAVGYLKASNAGADDLFGWSVALSGDGNTLAVSALYEDSNATGIDGDQANDSASNSGAVYVFVRDGMGSWSQQAYIKASNTDSDDAFGISVALSDDGNTLAVGADAEASNATGIDGDQADDSAFQAGAVHVFVRDGEGSWSQQAYIKASNTDAYDLFGHVLALSGDGNTLAVSALFESSSAMGIDGDQSDDSASQAGAVYVFVRDGMSSWSQQAYVKASNTSAGDLFGHGVALSGDGNTLAVGAQWEDSSATGIDGDQSNDSAPWSGAVYVFVRDDMGTWSQQAYVKASNTSPSDVFGIGVALSQDGDTLAVGAYEEDSNATGIDGDQASDASDSSGAVYVFVRDETDTWSQQAYIKASNTGDFDHFGWMVSLSEAGDTLAVGAYYENSGAIGIEGDQTLETAPWSGAVYVFVRNGMGTWAQQTYVKAPNTVWGTFFGFSVELSRDGTTLAIGSTYEGSNTTTGIYASGAVYLY